MASGGYLPSRKIPTKIDPEEKLFRKLNRAQNVQQFKKRLMIHQVINKRNQDLFGVFSEIITKR